jgi:hypothetical protein
MILSFGYRVMLGDALGDAMRGVKPKSLLFDAARLGGATIATPQGKGRT